MGEETGRHVRGVVTDVAKRRDLFAAPVHDVRTARVKRAAGRQRDQAGWLARNGPQALTPSEIVDLARQLEAVASALGRPVNR